MRVTAKKVKVSEIFDGYCDLGDDGVYAYGGKLAIRPEYQREFVYSVDKAAEVVRTVIRGFPLNIMYWVSIGNDRYEVLDGQQRTLSVMQYLDHKFPVNLNGRSYYWDSLPDDVYDRVVNYEFDIYVCEGDESEKLEWFRVVNIAGERLTDQELRNSVYTGTWLTDAKRHFSKRNCAAKGLSEKYLTGDPNRQELLERALRGICDLKGISDVSEYMSAHKNDGDSDELWQYFQDVINWTVKIFPKYYPDMKGLDWCKMYNAYHNNTYNSSTILTELERLHADDEIQKSKGIYEYLLCRETDPYAGRLLNLRAFDKRDKMNAYNKQNGKCPICKLSFAYDDMEGDHIIPWSRGGRTVSENCQMLCKSCNSKKSDKY